MNQLQFTNSATILAAIAVILGTGIAIYSIIAALRTHDVWRRWCYGGGVALGAYTAYGYCVVLFVDPAASVAWLRPAIIFWMLLYLTVTRVMALVITTSPSEQMMAEIKRVSYENINRQQDNENARGTNTILVEQIRETDAENKELTTALAGARAELATLATKLIEAEEELARLRGRG